MYMYLSDKYKVYIVMTSQYPSVGIFVHSFNSLNTASATCNTVLRLLDEKGCTRQVL